MSDLIRSAVLACIVAGVASRAGAQRYRVAIGVPGGQTAIAEFRPCIPAEGSGCGAWIDHTSPSTDGQPPVVKSALTRNGSDSVSIENGGVRMRSMKKSASGAAKVLGIRQSVARAIALSGDSRYVFAAYESTAVDGVVVYMIDLDTRTAIASLAIPRLDGGISMAP
jgi:hypothetical protein